MGSVILATHGWWLLLLPPLKTLLPFLFPNFVPAVHGATAPCLLCRDLSILLLKWGCLGLLLPRRRVPTRLLLLGPHLLLLLWLLLPRMGSMPTSTRWLLAGTRPSARRYNYLWRFPLAARGRLRECGGLAVTICHRLRVMVERGVGAVDSARVGMFVRRRVGGVRVPTTARGTGLGSARSSSRACWLP